MRIGIIGFGSIGNRHYQNLQRFDAEIVVLTKRADLPEIHSIASWDEFKDSGNFDAIFVTNETAKHLDTIHKCVQLKPKALFIEKPLSHQSAGLENLSALLKEQNISAWVGYNFHFFEPFIRVKEIIKSGKLGKIYYMRVAVGQDLSEWRPRDYHLCYSSKEAGGGGVMLDLVHDLNYPAWFIDEQLQPEACVMKRVSSLGIEVEDCVESVLQSVSGIVVSVHQDYVRVPYRRSLEIAGTEASLNWDTDDNTIIILDRKKNIIVKEKIDTDRNIMYEKEVEFFINSVKRGDFFSNLDEAIRDVKIIERLKKYAQ